jgi:hypothetical protein
VIGLSLCLLGLLASVAVQERGAQMDQVEVGRG